jgi:hydrogenase/urease accessory protein HupE
MRKPLPSLITIAIAATQVSNALAHPGHGLSGADDVTVFHYLTEPVHALPILSLVIAVLLVERYSRGRRGRTSRPNLESSE